MLPLASDAAAGPAAVRAGYRRAPRRHRDRRGRAAARRWPRPARPARPLRRADRHCGPARRRRGTRRAPSCPAPSSPSSLHDLPEGRLPAVWAQVKEILEDVARACSPDCHHRAVTGRRASGSPDRRRDRADRLPRPALPRPTRSRSGTVTSAARRCTSRCPPDIAQRKVELLHKCFPSQRHRDWWDDEVFLGLARLRGMECRARVRRGVHLHEIGNRRRPASRLYPVGCFRRLSGS